MIRGFLSVLKILLVFAATIINIPAAGQSTAELAQKNLHRQKWQRAYELLNRALAKDSLNVTAKYVLAQYFFSEQNPSFHLDSAYRYVLEAMDDFQNTSQRQRDKLRRFPLDSAQLVFLRQKIEEVAFTNAKSVQTEAAWIYFANHFFLSASLPRAIALRDSIAYQDAVRENTYQSFKNFLEKYPHALQVSLAKHHYERLLFKAKTSDLSLTSFEAFLSAYPNSPYRSLAEQTIFEYKTVSGEWQSYVDFIRAYPSNSSVKKAKNILFHLIPEQQRSQKWPEDFANDSLSHVIELAHTYLTPFLRNKKFGFMDSEGREIIPASADSIDEAYLCGNIIEDIVSLPNQLISKNGSVILQKKVTSLDEIGFGFLIAEVDACKRVIHKTGFQIAEDCIDNARIINDKFVAVQKHEQWSIWSLSGRRLIEKAEGILSVKDVIGVRESNKKIKLLHSQTFAALPPPPELGGVMYDEVKSWNNDLIFVKDKNNVGLLDQSLKVFVGLKNQTLTPAFFGVVATDSSGSQLYNYSGQRSKTFTQVLPREPWVAAKDSAWKLLDPITMEIVSGPYDTLVFHGSFPTGTRRDSTHIFFRKDNVWKGIKPAAIEFIPGKDSSRFLLIDQKNISVLFNDRGEKLLNVPYDKIQHAGQDFFIVHRKEKKGLINKRGKLLLPVEYDAIGSVNNGVVSLLKSMQFGLFDCTKRKRIPAQYQKNLIPYNKHIITAYKGGLLGFIDWDNKPLSKFEFDEIEYWNDTTALVKKNSHWALYEITNGKVLIDNIKDYKLIQNTLQKKLAIIYQEMNHGVIDSQRGVIIPVSFNYIINVGSTEKPLYFTGKHISEASIFVVIYYNDQGNMLRKEIYDQVDYDKIYCDEE